MHVVLGPVFIGDVNAKLVWLAVHPLPHLVLSCHWYLSALYDLATMKRRVKERDERKRKKMKPIKTEPEDFPDAPEEADIMPALLPSDSLNLTSVKEE